MLCVNEDMINRQTRGWQDARSQSWPPEPALDMHRERKPGTESVSATTMYSEQRSLNKTTVYHIVFEIVFQEDWYIAMRTKQENLISRLICIGKPSVCSQNDHLEVPREGTSQAKL